jgi:inner membrane protein involved in colicin E2 resistance
MENSERYEKQPITNEEYFSALHLGIDKTTQIDAEKGQLPRKQQSRFKNNLGEFFLDEVSQQFGLKYTYNITLTKSIDNCQQKYETDGQFITQIIALTFEVFFIFFTIVLY